MISGLLESTLRYYEQLGIIAPIARDPSSGASRLFEKLIEKNRNIIEQVKRLQPDAKQ